ncbi:MULTISPECIES: MFS transporter [Streptomyces]|uniref:MFS transporter n=2 Tax=Streptomyces viridosporus TaxID=67581 RepID=A0ABX6AIK9_STRVD|nr:MULTISPECIES: MFS transporter [Streptomyces]EFE68210.1 major facilitator transporter [Streptomyces viridosporus ATCC 14672]PWJ03616.1 MFS transporter [Streptomyces sp. NWU49]QEU86824.1 MFS transporter [Streptomyces viridosporus T7A]
MSKPAKSAKQQNPLRSAFAALAGTSIEWYDFYAFATAAAIVFDDVFFPADMPPVLRTMSAFATFAVGFLLRPLGGIVFGHIGDRVGRKNTLVITLMMMGVASFAIGLLPTYAQVGALAPTLLIILRLIQGIAIGGEWGGAVLIAVENAPKGRATFFGSFAQLGSSVGALLSTGAFSLMHLWGDEAFKTWGWRVPFLASAVLVVIGLLIRLKLEEAPVMDEIRAQRTVQDKLPVVEVFQTSWRTVLVGVFALATATGGYYIVTSYLLTYGTDELGLSEAMLLNGLTLAAFVELVVTPGLSWLGDRVGAHKVVIAGLFGVVVLSVPQFLVMGTGSVFLIYAAMMAMRFTMSALYGPIAAILAEGFPPRVRYTGISLSYQICNMIFGGFAPLAALSLTALVGGHYWPAAALLMLISAVGIWCTALLRRMRDTYPEPLTTDRDAVPAGV